MTEESEQQGASWDYEYPEELETEGRMRPSLKHAVERHEAGGDGDSAATASARVPETQTDKIARIKRELEAVPTEPGVYLWKDAAGEVIYVGKAKQLRARSCLALPT